MNLLYGDSLIVAQLARACLAAGRLDEAGARAAEALALARKRGERGEEARALLLHGEIAVEREPSALEPARAGLDQALALGDELGLRPMAVRCRMIRGALELKAGRREEAETWLAPAVAEFQAMSIGAWLARAERLLAQAKEH
jgi:hypothetical protein